VANFFGELFFKKSIKIPFFQKLSPKIEKNSKKSPCFLHIVQATAGYKRILLNCCFRGWSIAKGG
jgi:hypothetical protein